ncbi:hypothetical protein JXA40_10895 [bacterium]|nr:hypothetical protein [candidate division CSSED10-310 bacterium]
MQRTAAYTAILVVVLTTWAVSSANHRPETLKDLYYSARDLEDQDAYREPTDRELKEFSDLMDQLLVCIRSGQTGRISQLVPVADGLGFQIRQSVRGAGREYTVIMEKGKLRFGGGFYAVAETPPPVRPALVQTPHARSDAFTGRIGIRVVLKTRSAAFFSSTMPRDRLISGDRDITEISDPAHNARSFFQCATETFARHNPDLLVIQLHGFRKNDERNFDAILSSGQSISRHSELQSRIAECIRENFRDRTIAVFGRDTNELGALTNIQGRYINTKTSGLFLHLEMDWEFRKSIVKAEPMMKRFTRCVNRIISIYETMPVR